MTVELERLEAKFAIEEERAEPADLELYSRASANLRRLFEAVGLKRRPRNVTPSLREYLDARQAEDDAAAAADDVCVDGDVVDVEPEEIGRAADQ